MDAGRIESFKLGERKTWVRRASLAAYVGPEAAERLGLDKPLAGEAA